MINKLLAILPFLIAQISFGQNGEVELIISPQNADVGEVLTITVKHRMQGDVKIENLPASYVDGYQVLAGMESQMDHNTGDLITLFYKSQTGAIGKAGTYTIGPAYVKQGNKSFYSNKVTVNIGDKTQMTPSGITSKQLNDPAFGIIHTNKNVLYEGEPLLVSAKVYAHFNPTHLDNYRSYSMKGIVSQYPIGNSSRINKTQERFKGMDLYSFEYDKNIVFPIGTGQFRIDSYVMNLYQGLQGFMLTSSGAEIEIKPLPGNQPADFIGAVGTFELQREIEENDIQQGDVVKMTVTVSGNGNLQNILEPKPSLPKGFIVYGDPQITENISYTSRGAEGEMIYVYNVQVNKYGDLKLPPMSVSYFDPDKEEYITITSEEKVIASEKNDDFIAEEVENQSENDLNELLPLAQLRRSNVVEDDNELYGSTLFWTGVGFPLLSSLFLLFITRQRKHSEEKVIVRETVKRRDSELSEQLITLKTLTTSEDDNAFYAKIETALKKAFERELKVKDDRILNREEIFAFLENSNRFDLLQKVKSLLEKCEQFRFGFGSISTSKKETLEELNNILKSLK